MIGLLLISSPQCLLALCSHQNCSSSGHSLLLCWSSPCVWAGDVSWQYTRRTETCKVIWALIFGVLWDYPSQTFSAAAQLSSFSQPFLNFNSISFFSCPLLRSISHVSIDCSLWNWCFISIFFYLPCCRSQLADSCFAAMSCGSAERFKFISFSCSPDACVLIHCNSVPWYSAEYSQTHILGWLEKIA